jgi:hypothetical protein
MLDKMGNPGLGRWLEHRAGMYPYACNHRLDMRDLLCGKPYAAIQSFGFDHLTLPDTRRHMHPAGHTANLISKIDFVNVFNTHLLCN